MIRLLAFFLVSLCLLGGCKSIPLESIGFCYTDENGRQYCGDIGISKGKTTAEKSVVLEEKPKEPGDEPKTLYTFTEEEVRVLASQLGNMNPLEEKEVSTSSKTEAPPAYMKPGLTDFRRCKLYLQEQLE